MALRRKLNTNGTSKALNIPSQWLENLGNVEFVNLEMYPDRIVVTPILGEREIPKEPRPTPKSVVSDPIVQQPIVEEVSRRPEKRVYTAEELARKYS